MADSISFLRFDGRLSEDFRFTKYLGWETDRIAHRPDTGNGEYRVALMDERGQALSEAFPRVDFATGCGHASGGRSARVTAYVQLHPQGRQLVFTRGAQTIWHSAVADRPPALSDVQVIAKDPDSYVLRWTAQPRAPQPVTFRVFYFIDQKFGFTLASELTGNEFVADIARLPGGAACQFGVLATDGMRSQVRLTGSFAVPHRPPRVMVHTPHRGAVLHHSSPVSAAGSAFDAFGHELPAEALLWILDGRVLAKATRVVEVSWLEPGRHRLALHYHGPDGVRAEDEVEFSVTAPTEFESEWTKTYRQAIARVGHAG